MIYEANKGRNFIFAQISEKAAENLKAEVSSNIQKEISKALVDSLYDVKISIKDAGNGADALQAGTQKLFDGSKELTNGMEKAEDGSIQFKNGLKQADNGATNLQNGTQKLLDGSINLSSGMDIASDGSKQLQVGLESLTNGESKMADGSTSLVNGLNSFKNSLIKPNDQIPVLVKGVLDVSNNTELIEQGAEKLDNSLNGLNSLADGVKQANDGINQADSIFNEELNNIDNSNLNQAGKDKLKSAISIINKVNSANISNNIEVPLRTAANSAQPLVNSLKQLKDGTKQISDGVHELSNGLTNSQKKAEQGLDQLINGAIEMKNGSSSMLTGLNTATQKNGELSSGLNNLNNGSILLRDGLRTVKYGSINLENGLNTAVENTGELSYGLKQLSDGLNNGYGKINKNLKFNSEDMSKFVSEPINLKDNSINDVKHYGEGLAPYFISLSLWLGAMFVNFILSIIKSINIVKNRFLKSFAGKFMIGSGLAIVQALILSFAIVKGLNIDVTSINNFYVSNMFIAIVFFSVMYGLSYAIGIISAPIMFIVFLLRLSSSGGTFPIETAPQFYRVIGQVFPMTYAISTLRMIISGINSDVLNNNIIIMLSFVVSFLGGGFLFKKIVDILKKKNKVIKDLEVA